MAVRPPVAMAMYGLCIVMAILMCLVLFSISTSTHTRGSNTESQLFVREVNAALSQRVASTASFYMTHTELDMFLEAQDHAGAHLKRPAIVSDDVVVFVKTFHECKARIRALKGSYMLWAKNVFIISDEADAELGIETFPASLNYTWGANRYQGHHLYTYIGLLWQQRPEIWSKSYFVISDDDTWINIPYLLRFLRPYSPDLKLHFTALQLGGLSPMQRLWCSTYGHDCNKTGIVWGGGGAGAVLTRAAMVQVASKIHTGECPWLYHDDATFSRCAASAAQVPLILSYEFDMHVRSHGTRWPVHDHLTIHKVVPRCDAPDTVLQQQFRELKRWSCHTAHRYQYQPEAIPECSLPEFRDPSAYYTTE